MHTKIKQALYLVGLSNSSKEKVVTYSFGMRQRLHLSKMLILDFVQLMVNHLYLSREVSSNILKEFLEGIVTNRDYNCYVEREILDVENSIRGVSCAS